MAVPLSKRIIHNISLEAVPNSMYSSERVGAGLVPARRCTTIVEAARTAGGGEPRPYNRSVHRTGNRSSSSIDHNQPDAMRVAKSGLTDNWLRTS